MNNDRRSSRSSSSWDGVADWYLGWSGARGSLHHRKLAIPMVMDLLDCRRGQQILDIGCGPGALAAHVRNAGAHYTGIDLSAKLIAFGRRHNPEARFLVGDATRLPQHPQLRPHTFDAAVFLLSVQDIAPLAQAMTSAAWVLKPGGRLVMLMTHPCFRIPRQSGWGWDGQRRLWYRRIDRYLTELEIPMQPHTRGTGITRSYHRPLSVYIAALTAAGFIVDALRESPMLPNRDRRALRSGQRADNCDIPLFLALGARLPGD